MAFYTKEKFLKYCSIVGAHLITAPLSFGWVYGNLSAYMDSYFRFSCSPGCMDGDSQWILGICLAMNCPGTLLTKLLEDRVGLKWTGLVAAIAVNAALFGSAWTVQLSVAWTTVLLGVILGLVQGLTSVVAFQHVGLWAPDKTALFIATTTGVSTLLSVAQNQIITAIVNPENLKPDAVRGSRAFFSQPQVLNKVPTALIAYAAITLGLQFAGYLLMSQPPHQHASRYSEDIRDTNDQSGSSKNVARNKDVIALIAEAQRIGQNSVTYGSNIVSDLATSNSFCDRLSAHVSVDITEEIPTEAAQSEGKLRSLEPSQVLKTSVFYTVFMFGVATVYSLLLKANYYKQFALLYIEDDRYLTLIGTLIPVVAALSRSWLGAVLNKRVITTKTAMVVSLAINSGLCAVWYLVPQTDAVLYMFFILGLAVVQSLYYVILPLACLEIFGPAHFSINYGLLLSSLLLVGLLSPVVISPLLHGLGWFWLFGSASILCLVALVCVVSTDFYPPEPLRTKC